MKIPQSFLPSSTFAAGPAQGLEEVRETALAETFFERRHRTPFITQELYKKTALDLKKLFKLPKDYLVIFFPGGATAAMDAVAWSLNEGSVSGLNLGAFSELWNKKICGALPPDVKKDFVDFDYKNPESAKKLNAKSSLVLLTPNETSTGLALPDILLKEIYARKGKNTLVAWDATSCAGARALPGCFDVMLFAGQKAFGAPGGTCVIFLSPAAVKRALAAEHKKEIPYFLNLSRAVQKALIFQPFNTPCNTTIWAIGKACAYMLKRGGLKSMQELTIKHAKTVLDYAKKSRWLKPLIEEEKYRSFTTLTLKIADPDIKDAQINKALAATKRANLIDGIEKYSSVKENSLRIGCFPFIDAKGCAQFKKLCRTLDFIYKELKKVKK